MSESADGVGDVSALVRVLEDTFTKLRRLIESTEQIISTVSGVEKHRGAAREDVREHAVVRAFKPNNAAPSVESTVTCRDAGAVIDAGRGRVARNALVVMLSQLLVWIAGAAPFVILPRFLGDANIGKLTFAFGFTGMFVAFVLLGANTFVTREVARDASTAAHLTFNAIVARIPAVLLSCALIAAFVILLGYPASTRYVVFIATAIMLVTTTSTILGAALQGMERMTLTSALNVLEKVLTAAVGLSLIAFAGKGLVSWSLAVLGIDIIIFLILSTYVLRVVGHSFEVDLATCRRIIRSGAPFLVYNISLLIYGGIDVTMLSVMTRDAVVGWYGVAYRFIGIPGVIPFAVITALLPLMSRTRGEEFSALARRSLDILILVTVPIGVGLVVGAGPLIHVMRYPAAFDHSIILIRILALHVPLVAISMVAGTVLVAQDREGAWMRVGILAAILNPAVNLFAIPYFEHVYGDGAIGASITTVVTECFVVTAGILLVEHGTFARSNMITALRCLAASSVMIPVMLLTMPFGLIVMAAAGGGAYGVSAVAVGAISVGELRRLPSLVFARPIADRATG